MVKKNNMMCVRLIGKEIKGDRTARDMRERWGLCFPAELIAKPKFRRLDGTKRRPF